MPRRKRLKVEHLHDGEWWFPTQKGSVHICCDCDLVHDIEVRVLKSGETPDGKVRVDPAIRFWRNNRATSARRRRKKQVF